MPPTSRQPYVTLGELVSEFFSPALSFPIPHKGNLGTSFVYYTALAGCTYGVVSCTASVIGKIRNYIPPRELLRTLVEAAEKTREHFYLLQIPPLLRWLG